MQHYDQEVIKPLRIEAGHTSLTIHFLFTTIKVYMTSPIKDLRRGQGGSQSIGPYTTGSSNQRPDKNISRIIGCYRPAVAYGYRFPMDPWPYYFLMLKRWTSIWGNKLKAFFRIIAKKNLKTFYIIQKIFLIVRYINNTFYLVRLIQLDDICNRQNGQKSLDGYDNGTGSELEL